MSILFSGDFHANENNEMLAITKKALIKKYGTEKYRDIKYHIILGDGGFPLSVNDINEAKIHAGLDQRPFPILCVIGNHDPILGLDCVPEADIGIGENVQVIKRANPFIAYLKR